MTPKSYRFGLVLLVTALIALVGLAVSYRPPVTETTAVVQSAVWARIPPGQALVAFHALFLTLIGLIGGIVGTYRFSKLGPLLLVVGAVSLLTYFQFEPRAAATEMPLTVQLAALFGLGLVAPFVTRNRERLPGTWSWLLYLFPGMLTVIGLQTLRARWIIEPVSATPAQELLLSAIFTLIGALISLAVRGAAKPLFNDKLKDIAFVKGASGAAAKGRSRRTVFQALLLTFFIGTIASSFLIDRNLPTARQWLLTAPLIPAVMAIYAPYSWMTAGAPTEVFQPSEMPTSVQQMRFFLGVMFQYLTVGTVISVYQALRHPRSTFRLVLAEVMIVLYWLPALWFLWTLGRYEGLV